MAAEKGSLSINSENIFPIIKKWLYSDHDIFYRELVSNGCDAITKLKKLAAFGEFNEPEGEKYQLTVKVNPDEKTIKIIDNGIGMTADEVKEYINQIAFSGAADFLEKYKDKTSDDQIIGHFGLGFYSAFMVAHRVTIDTLSWKPDSKPVFWVSDEGTEFEMMEGDRTLRGTEITLYLNEDSYEFCNEFRAKEVIEKYCSFMPVPIFFENECAKKEEKPEDAKVVDAEVDADGNVKSAEDNEPKPVNDPEPLWKKHPNECTEEEYKEFYRKVFHDYKEPLFWIHLNMDYPFNLKGIIYFPRINMEYDTLEGMIKLYSNQVFIADNIKEVIPEFLMLLKGVMDCPDLPLNVSRSALQNDGFVKKISDYITKKVAEKLSGMFKTDRENYEKYWDDIAPFIEFGCLKDTKFKDKMKDYILFKDIDGKYLTLEEYIKASKGEEEAETAAENNTENTADNTGSDSEPVKDKVFYVTDEKQQSQYISMFRSEGLNAVILNHNIDQPFISMLEQENQNVSFLRIDADISDTFKQETGEEEKKALTEETEKLTKLFRDILGKEKLEVKVEKLKSADISSIITLSEENRRMADMMKMYSMPGMDTDMFGGSETLTLNSENVLVKYIYEKQEGKNVELIAKQLYDLAMLSHKPLSPEAMGEFIKRSNEIMAVLAEK